MIARSAVSSTAPLALALALVCAVLSAPQATAQSEGFVQQQPGQRVYDQAGVLSPTETVSNPFLEVQPYTGERYDAKQKNQAVAAGGDECRTIGAAATDTALPDDHSDDLDHESTRKGNRR